MRGTGNSEDEIGKPAGSDPGGARDAAPRTKTRRKNANNVITLRGRRGMLYASLDVHKKTIQVAVLDGKRNMALVHLGDLRMSLFNR